MKKLILLPFLIMLNLPALAQEKDNTTYPYDPATTPKEDIEPGEIIERKFSVSRIYPGTERTYWIYVPAGYTADRPACLYVCMDGIQYNAPVIFDNLIAWGEMPVTIGIFIGSGSVRDANGRVLRYNRSNEFDRTGDTFYRFLMEELLPDAVKQKTIDGQSIRISDDPNDRMIAGTSSGAICAFTAAWLHPDSFSRVFSAIGTYVAMRGGNEYPALIRKTEPKPLRIFLEDGINDAWNPLFGSWYEANVLMESALNFAGYEVMHSWGRGGHDGAHAGHIFPDVIRWLWKGWPGKVKRGNSLNDMLWNILPENSSWEKVGLTGTPSGDIFPDITGGVVFQDLTGKIQWISPDLKPVGTLEVPASERLIGTDGTEVITTNTKGIITGWKDGEKRTITQGIPGATSLLVTNNRDIYLSGLLPEDKCALWHIKPDGSSQKIDQLPRGGTSLAMYPNHKLLMQTEKDSHWIYNYIIDSDGVLRDGQRFYWLHNTENSELSGTGKMIFDEKGNLYVATDMGIQVCDQNGRVRAILTLPSGRITSLAFGGKNRNILYALSAGKIYFRIMKVRGIEPWMEPADPESQGAG